MELKVEDLFFQYEEGMELKNISMNVKNGKFIGVIGPNGSGKSTLLKNIYRVLKPQKGVVLLNDKNIHEMSYKVSAQKMAVVEQYQNEVFDFTVEEIVKMGRTPYKKIFEADNKIDEEHVEKALKYVGLESYREKNYSELSGGEKQRVILARALCQNTQFLILDEPTNHLDIYYQLQIFNLVKKLGVTVLSVIHDLNMACLYCDEVYILKDGKIYSYGKTEEVITTAMIREVFKVESEIIVHPLTKKPHIIFLTEEVKNEKRD